jgi:ubiquinone/menaquinone biosynthesis C-methylase UbiE
VKTLEMSQHARDWGALWGYQPDAWAITEEQQTPVYEAALARVPVGPDTHVLDVGCATGVFLRMCADRGATVAGIDAAERLLALAGRRVPEAELCHGDMQALPYEDGRFDVVTGFTAFFFAEDMVAALREAVRVARPGAPVVMQGFGRPDRCDLEAMKAAVAPFRDETHRSYWRPGAAEAIAKRAGLAIADAFDVRSPYVYPDEDAMLDAMLAAGGAALAGGPERAGEVRAAVAGALARCRRPDGSYRVANEWRVVVGITPDAQRLGN